jgi:hypothetical protein
MKAPDDADPVTTSGGIAGVTGYDVQATAILELILADELPPAVEVRPEGQDDLEFRWVDSATGQTRRRYHQIKKATDSDTDDEWSLAKIARVLLGNAVAKLQGNNDEQVWVLGDRLEEDVHQLLHAGRDAPEQRRQIYLNALHRLAKAEAQVTEDLSDTHLKHRLDHWNPTSNGGPIDHDIERIVATFATLSVGVSQNRVDNYRLRMAELHRVLPDVLARISAHSYHGTERQIADRVRQLLIDRYELDPRTVQDVIFRNLRGFINDVSKEPGRLFTLEEFEEELVNAWPCRVMPTQPRPFQDEHVPRPELVQALLAAPLACEAVGPSGSGKSTLASEVHSALESRRADAIALFVEVRTRTSLRDVLVGVAYKLGRRGIRRLIRPALDLRSSDTETIERAAKSLAPLASEIFLLIDCADSEVSNEFRRDLGVFTRALQGTSFHVLAFAQMSVFRALTPVERTALAITQEPMPGLNFGQFLALLRRRHPYLDHSAAYDLFDRLSSGLPMGVLPNLAQQLAHAQSLAEMQAFVNRPPEQRLSAAHRDRFNSIPPTLHQAASRVVCLSLPLPPDELVALFPQDPLKAALQALVEEGLLPPFVDRVEMHETVRAGLESFVTPAVAKETHEKLAEHFASRHMLPAHIYHLERAGRVDEAREIARTRFLAGEDWNDLVEYIGAHKCVSAGEALPLLLEGNHDRKYLLSDLLPCIQTPETTQSLFEALTSVPERYAKDFQQRWLLQETLLKCDPARLTAIVDFVLRQPEQGRQDVLDSLRICARRAGVAPDQTFVQWFRSLRLEDKKRTVGFLLLKPDLPRLQEALAFMYRHSLTLGSRRGHSYQVPILDLATDRNIEEFLEALPPVEPSAMLIARSALLGPFEGYVWQEHLALRRVCLALVRSGTAAPAVLTNAIRILIFLNEREVISLVRPLRAADGPLASIAWMAPAILDDSDELPKLESIVVASETGVKSRVMAMVIASHLGADIETLLDRANAVRPEQQNELETFLLLQAVLVPFPRAVSLLLAALNKGRIHPSLMGGILSRVAEASFPGTEGLLIKALGSSDPTLVAHALVASERCRFQGVLTPILNLVRNTEAGDMPAFAIPAAMACGLDSIEPLRDIWERTPKAAHWRLVLAGRLRDTNEASLIIASATDMSLDWKRRRLAIVAASRLPYNAAMETIASVILVTLPVLAEESVSLHSHSLLTGLLDICGAKDLLTLFHRGRECFLHELAGIYDNWAKQLIGKQELLGAADAVGWLWDRLANYGFDRDPRGFDRVANELHLPMLQRATLLGLRRQGRRDELFSACERATTNWLRICAFAQLCQGDPIPADEEHRLQTIIRGAPPPLQTILGRISAGRPQSKQPQPASRPDRTPPPPAHISFDFEGAKAFLLSVGRVEPRAIALVLEEHELRALVADLKSERDSQWRPARDTKPARMSLSENGWRLRFGFALEQTSPHYEQRTALRPAVAAANRFGMNIPWHRAELNGDLGNVYADRFFTSLGAQNDRDTFLQILTNEAEQLVPLLDKPNRVDAVIHLVDERILPILDRFLQSGHGVFFEQMCRLICQVRTEAVRPVLTKAFRRWLVLLEQLQVRPAPADPDTPGWWTVWHTLPRLREHPHFFSIPQVRYRILDIVVRHQELGFGNREQLLKLLTEWPPAYLQFEREGFRAAEFGHFPDAVERYDDIADALFRRTG